MSQNHLQRIRTGILLAGAAMLLSSASFAAAFVVPGGGRARTDCLSVFEIPVDIPKRRWVCTDGDPACDADGEVNGECVFSVGICANSTHDPGRCTLQGVNFIEVEHSEDDGDPKFDPDFQALQARIDNQIEPPTADADACTSATGITVRVIGPLQNNYCKRGRKKIRTEARSEVIDGKIFREKDTLRLTCVPAPDGCDPTSLFDSTYDRIQTQIFNQSCAKSACHDSETNQADLLLEVGAALGELIDVDPTNAVAAGMGWKRVTRDLAPDGNGENGSGDAETSFLFHKVNDTLSPGMGARMPLNAPKLRPSLIEIVRLWIEAGAPANGWVPGTDQ